MDFQHDEFLHDSSRKAADDATRFVKANPESLKDYLHKARNAKYPLCMRSARVIQLFAPGNDALIEPYIDEIVDTIRDTKETGVRRSFLKIFIDTELVYKTNRQGEIADLCFKYIMNPKEAIAIRAYSIGVLLKIIEKEPDLARELELCLEILENDPSPGLHAWFAKIRKTIKKK
jgi:hypothetical protein